MKWPSGPLEINLQAKAATLTPELKEALQNWHDPSTLDLVEKTPVNCLVVTWAAGLRQDEEQQRSLRLLLSRGQQAGLNFVGRVEAGADKAAAMATAQAAGLSGLAMEEPSESNSRLKMIAWSRRSKVRWNSASPILAINDGIWPQIRGISGNNGNVVIAGPTGIPWINSNGWLIQLATALSAGKKIWLAHDPPNTIDVHKAEAYSLALADSETYGARWILSLDDHFRGSLSKRSSQSLDEWKKITSVLSFFRSHSDWSLFQPKSILGVISSFSGANEFMSGEVLNLLGRRHVPFCIIEKSKAVTASFEGLQAILYIDPEPPPSELRQKLLTFVSRQGLVIVPQTWGKPEEASPEQPERLHTLYSFGKGRLAVAQEDIQDPYLLAEEAHLLMSHRRDLVRLWNAPAMNSHYTVSADGRKELVQIVNYSWRDSGDTVSIWLRKPYRSARFWMLGKKEPVPLTGIPEQGGMEYHLPLVSIYGALELDN